VVIHEGQGAKAVVWRGDQASESPSHFTDIDNGRFEVLETLASFKISKWDTPEMVAEKKAMLEGYRAKGYCAASCPRDGVGKQTLFINAVIQSREETEAQLPWLVEMELPRAATAAAAAAAATPNGPEGEESGQGVKRGLSLLPFPLFETSNFLRRARKRQPSSIACRSYNNITV
jgi:hypothetical protein